MENGSHTHMHNKLMNIYSFHVVIGAIFLREFLFFKFGGSFQNVIKGTVVVSFFSQWLTHTQSGTCIIC
jgi:hypothetical protein